MKEDIEYYRKIASLTAELDGWEKEVFEIAISADKEFSAEEAKQVSLWLFQLWEAAAHYKGRLQALEKLEGERLQDLTHREIK